MRSDEEDGFRKSTLNFNLASHFFRTKDGNAQYSNDREKKIIHYKCE